MSNRGSIHSEGYITLSTLDFKKNESRLNHAFMFINYIFLPLHFLLSLMSYYNGSILRFDLDWVKAYKIGVFLPFMVLTLVTFI